MASKTPPQLHVFFLPYFALGHLIPMIDIAKLFAARGVKATVIAIPSRVSFMSEAIERSNQSGTEISIKIIEIPSLDGLNFFEVMTVLLKSFEKLVQKLKPDCLVADTCYPWATGMANKFRIPRLVFQGTSAFSLCASECLWIYEPHKKVESESEPFVVPFLPGEIKFTKQQLQDYMKEDAESLKRKMRKECRDSELKSYGIIINSFYELENTYADYYRNDLRRKTWHIGPVSLCNSAMEDKARRGKKSAIDENQCLEWLNSKEPNCVIYICFGSLTKFTSAQLKEIAIALELSNQQFIWVVRGKKKKNEQDDWLPEGFEERMEGKGLIIRGWAPQILILGHESVGGFVTHCGWNSTLEGVSAGVPIVTWPVSAEQFYNEKQVTEILKIGVSVGAKIWKEMVGDFVKSEAIEKAVKEMMVGDKAREMRSRAKTLAEAAKKAVEIGGSSYSSLNALIEELKLRRG